MIISQVKNQEEEDEENIKNNKTDRYYEALKNSEIEKVWVDIWEKWKRQDVYILKNKYFLSKKINI